MKKVLFLCTGNSCRSQMAEGWTRHLFPDAIRAYSAGTAAHGLNPLATKVMAERGVDITSHRSKHVEELRDIPFDLIITVCGHAHEHCPVWFDNGRVLHQGFDDPPQLAKSARTEEEALQHYRQVRDQIEEFVQRLPQLLER